MYKLFVVTFAGGKAISTEVIGYEHEGQADVAAEMLVDASGKSFNVVVTRLY